MKKIIHLLPNAHLDPVWLWDRSEGLNEGIRTCRALVRLLEEFPEMVFNRGEAAIYHHIETFDPELWEHILDLVNAGRWECVGGNWVQTDHNMPSTESLFRHYREGQQYFREKFGRPAVTAWAPDSFGHSAGIPDLLAANGFQYFSFMRPQKLELPDDLFRWSGPGGGTLLAYRLLSYTAERDVAPGLDRLAAYQTERNGRNIGIGFGLGDHGGGTSRGQIEGALAWAAAHPEFEVRFSTFRSFFTALEDEIASGRELPEFQGELNYCLRGCYSSVPRFKRLYRQAESALLRAERTVETVTPPTHAPSPDLKPLWKMLFFNSFHDILPGSAIERALEQQSCQLCAVPLLVFNPLPRPFHGLIELEESLDYRPIYRFRREDPVVELRDDAGNLLPAQEIPEEHNAMKHCVWRKRLLVPVELPPTGWKVLTFATGTRPAPYPVPAGIPAVGCGENGIRNQHWQITGTVGEDSLSLMSAAGTLLPLSFALFRDRFGSWGGMSEEPESIHLQELLEVWKIRASRIVESGPLRAAIWFRIEGAASHLELTLRLAMDSPVIAAELRVFCRDRACRLFLRLPQAEQLLCDVPGGEVERRTEGQFPAVGWVKLRYPDGESFGFAADGAFGYDNEEGFFRYGVARRTLYAADEVDGASLHPELPVSAGELTLRFLLSSEANTIRQRSEELFLSPRVLAGWPHQGALPPAGSLLSVTPDCVRIVEFVREGDAIRLALQNCSGAPAEACITLPDRRRNLTLPPWRITAVSLER